MKLLLVGNPNSGKTTLLNGLTKSSFHTGNRGGVTIASQKAQYVYNDEKIEIIDLPGLFSLEEYSDEEKNAVDYIHSRDYDAIVQVVEASNLKASLQLTKSLSKFNKPILLYVNMYNELKNKGGNIDFEKLSKSLKVPALCGEAITEKGILLLKDAIAKRLFKTTQIVDIDSIIDASFVAGNFVLSKFDKLLISPKSAIPIYFLTLFVVFYLAFGKFGIGCFLSNVMADLFETLMLNASNILTNMSMSDFINGFFVKGIIGGVACVLTFLPQLAVMEFLLIALEQSGISSRLSLLADGFLSKIGLNGRAMFTLLSGFGCTAIAVSDTNSMDNKTAKQKIISLLPMISCSAKIPVYLFVSVVAFKNNSMLALITIYIVSIVFTMLFSFLNSKNNKKNSAPLIIEIPKLRMLNRSNVLKPLKKQIKQFIIKVGSIVVVVSGFVYLLVAVSVNFKLIDNAQIDKSLLAFLGKKIAFLFKPIGLNGWQIPSAMLSGLFSKEAIISTLYLVYPNGVSLSLAQGSALTTFIMFYTPCLTSLAIIYRETNFWFAFRLAVFQLLFALLLSYLVYAVITFKLVRIILIVAVCLLILSLFLYNYFIKRRKNEKFHLQSRRKAFKNDNERI